MAEVSTPPGSSSTSPKKAKAGGPSTKAVADKTRAAKADPAKNEPPAIAEKKKQAKATKKSIAAFDDADGVADETVALAKNRRLLKALTFQAIVIGTVAITMIVAMPFYQTRYQYYSMTPENKVTMMTPLFMPNLTDNAIKAWAANSVTEVLTIGFGDYDQRLMSQKHRFTSAGWNDFVHAFFEKKIGDILKTSQLVLTSVPSDDPTITSQSENEQHVYQWEVTVPVIMTYATNNNVTHAQNSTVKLTIIRVPYDEQNNGIAIDNWHQ